MKLLFIIILLSFSINYSFAKDDKCKIEIEKSDISLNWEAFKTPDKVGVKAWFKELGLEKDEYKGSTIKEAVEGMKFNIDTTSVRSRNAGRDAKLVKFFFGNMAGQYKIKGHINSYSDKKIVVTLIMNGLAKDIDLKVSQKKDIISAEGVVDVLEFGMDKSLNELNKACFDLHAGKTWPDVKVILSFKVEKDC